MRLIDADAAIEAFGLSEKTRKYGGDHSGYDTMMLYEIQDVLDNLPTFQPPTGRWEKRGTLIRCSKCKRSAWSLVFEDLVRSFKFCPNCGARMVTE